MSDTNFFYLIIGLFATTLLLTTFAAYTFGYQRGSRSFVDDDPTPEAMIVDELIPDTVTLSIGYLDADTGPIDIATGIIEVASHTVLMDNDRIERLKLEVARQKRLKLRYYHLLKAERLMMRDIIQGGGVQLTSYWRRWVRAQFANESPFWLSQSWLRIANIDRAGH